MALDAGVGIQRVVVAAEALVHAVLQQAMHQDDIATGEFVATGYIFCSRNSPWWQTNLRSRSCIRLQALHSQDDCLA